MRLVLSLLVALPCAFSLSVRAAELSSWDRFNLWNDCGSMKLIVESLPEEASDVGLEEEAIATSVRSRLRAARIYSSTAEPYLYVNVNIVGPAFGIGIYYNKILFDAASGEYNYAKTWQSASTGTHGRNSNYVLSSVSQHTDRFVDEYLRVNEKACTR